MPVDFWFALLSLLVEQFEAEHSDLMRVHGFRLLAMDGTRLDLFDSPKNRAHFGHGPEWPRRPRSPGTHDVAAVPAGTAPVPLRVGACIRGRGHDGGELA